MTESEPPKDQNSYSPEKIKITRQHQKIASKCGKELIELANSLQEQEQPEIELGKSLREHGEKIQQYMQKEARQAELAIEGEKEEKVVSSEAQNKATTYRRLATVEHTQAVREYNKYLQQRIQENKQKIEQHKRQNFS